MVLYKYAKAINAQCDEEVRQQAVDLSHMLLRGDLDGDSATLWLLGLSILNRYLDMH